MDDSKIRYFCKADELFGVLEAAHLNMGHKRKRDVFGTRLISRSIVRHVRYVVKCQLKKKIPKHGLVVQLILSDYMNSRCQVDLIDMQSEPDKDYRFIMNYQDHLTKFTILRPLKTKTAEEVAYQLIDIFCLFGAPCILQSDNGREFSQGSVERSNQDIRDILVAWMADNNTEKWSEGLRFIQSKKNRALHSVIKTSPYEAMFGSAQKIGLADSSLSSDMYSSIETEEELEQLLSSVKNNDQDKTDEEEVNEQSSEDKNIPQAGEELTSVQDVINIFTLFAENNEGFGQNVTCKLCIRKNSISVERECAKSGQKQQAQKMISFSNSKFPKVDIRTSVAVRVPDVDKGRVAPRNVLAVVAGINSSGLYQLGTKEGLLERFYARNEFIVAESNFIQLQDVLH
ncbi:KRAB-A domain-containing protein 2-like [Camponotus floridanus]|uniref:KRAB-A domain-containing protein 2-like n=1 Tax=Camponotus floridanus TaxID=104421 RepID=UPI000DC66A49|nr:KRAB-A domain-containing protein 2-like [Camponotus floridanus]